MKKLLINTISKIQLKLIERSLGDALLMDAKGNFIKPFNSSSESDKIDLETVALSLSRTKRFFGQTNFSVAQHSINMARIFIYKGKIEEAKAAAIHEASECFLGDLVTPLKKNFPLFSDIEKIILRKVFISCGVKYPISNEVHILDKQIVINEALAHMPNKEYWLSYGKPVSEDLLNAAGVDLNCWSDEKSYTEFIKLLKELELL